MQYWLQTDQIRRSKVISGLLGVQYCDSVDTFLLDIENNLIGISLSCNLSLKSRLLVA